MTVQQKLEDTKCIKVPGKTIKDCYLLSGHLLLIFTDNTWHCATADPSNLMAAYRDYPAENNPLVDSGILDLEEVGRYWQERELFVQQAGRTSAIQLYRVAVNKLDELGITKEEAELE